MKTILDDKTKFIKLGTIDSADLNVKIEKAFQLKLRNRFTKGHFSKDLYESIRPTKTKCPKL